MVEVQQNLQAAADQVVRLAAFDVDHKAHTARVVLVPRVIETLFRRQTHPTPQKWCTWLTIGHSSTASSSIQALPQCNNLANRETAAKRRSYAWLKPRCLPKRGAGPWRDRRKPRSRAARLRP